jgi:hypothetical protein
VVAVVLPLIGATVILGIWYWWSPLYTDVGYQPFQPVEFSHQIHAGEMGLDCRYCHNTVERAGHAAVPSTSTCMNCHSVVKAESELLEPVRASMREDTPIPWVRVHMLPDYAYFDHSVHVAAGVGCATCHGPSSPRTSPCRCPGASIATETRRRTSARATRSPTWVGTRRSPATTRRPTRRAHAK